MTASRTALSFASTTGAPAPDEALPLAVCVADDDDWVRERVSESLRAQGFRVVSVKDGRALCSLIDAWATGRQEPCAVILSDLSMPGASGLEALARLRRAGMTTPFLLMSGFVAEDEEDLARGLGVTMILDKPFDLGALPGTLRDVATRG